MFVFNPIDVSASNLTSLIPEPDTAVGEVEWVAGSYATGDRVIKTSTHLLYESATDANTDDPEVGVNAVPPTWVEVSATNRYRMFSDSGAAQTVYDDNLTVSIVPESVINSFATFNVTNVDDINITVVDPAEGEVYNEDYNLRDSSQIVDWYAYFFEPIISVKELLVNNLPSYKNATINITYYSDNPMIGICALGKEIELGLAEYGTSFSLKDYSRKEIDDFGNFTVVRRGTSKQVQYSGYSETARAQYLFERLAELSTIPCVWYGSGATNDSTLVYGYYDDSTINISNPSTTDISISIEGLI